MAFDELPRDGELCTDGVVPTAPGRRDRHGWLGVIPATEMRQCVIRAVRTYPMSGSGTLGCALRLCSPLVWLAPSAAVVG